MADALLGDRTGKMSILIGTLAAVSTQRGVPRPGLASTQTKQLVQISPWCNRQHVVPIGGPRIGPTDRRHPGSSPGGGFSKQVFGEA